MFGISLKWLLAGLVSVGLAASCGGSTETTKGSESHFLASCDEDADCSESLSCVCGVCTRECQAQERCDGLASLARCVELGDLPANARCADVSDVQGVCDAPCTENSGCSALGAAFRCQDGICRVPAGTTPTPTPVPRCEQPLVMGPCNASFQYFWHNPATFECEFISGGCGGNDNIFSTLEECSSVCAPSDDACSLPQVTGPCDAALERFWHNPETGACEPFTYGGCGGNGNNFETFAACELACEAPGPGNCDLPAEPGTCGSTVSRYWHNPATGSCEHFVYSGCGGNLNNYVSPEACQAACPHPATACALPADTGPCDALIPRFFHDARTGECEPFDYGGCEGNANNFGTLEACRAACVLPDEITSCTVSSDCKLVPSQCCEACTQQRLEDYVAVNHSFTGSLPPVGTACPENVCEQCDHASAASSRGLFGARCEAGRCVAYDVRESPVGECNPEAAPNTEGSCVLRAGLECCPRCDLSTGITPMNGEAARDFNGSLQCPDLACPPCEPVFPGAVMPTCSPMGVCGVAWTGP